MFSASLPYDVLALNYNAVFIWTVFIVVLLIFLYYLQRDEYLSNSIKRRGAISVSQLLLSGILATFCIAVFAYFPVEWGTFADREGYIYLFQTFDTRVGDSGNWGWEQITYLVRLFSTDYETYLLVIAMLYVIPRMIFCYGLSRNFVFVVFLTMVSSFMFMSYGTNTMRSGVASSILLMAFMLYYGKGFFRPIMAVILAFFAIEIHKSMAIPALAFVFALLFTKPKPLIVIWILSFFASFFFGGVIENMIGGLVEENAGEQAAGYILNEGSQGYNRGFRIDFIIYSAVPIVLGWYYIVKKGFNDRFYVVLYCTYIITNIFFILVIRANFVDRFGYLSWFLMPVLLVYPLVKRRLFVQQNIVLAFTLFLNEMFTFIMYLR